MSVRVMLTALALLAGCAGGSRAQQDLLGAILSARPPAGVQLVDSDRDVQDALAKIGASIRAGRSDEAVEGLHALIHSDKVVLLPRWDDARRYVPSPEVALRILGLLPDAALERANRLDDAAARRHLDEAVRDGREDLLRFASTKYFHTAHGGLAANALASAAFDRGAFLDASLLWERVYFEQRLSSLDRPLALAKAALAARLAGWESRAAALFERFRAAHGDARSVIGGRERNVLEFLRQALAAPPVALPPPPVLADWPAVGGSADGYAVMPDCTVSPLVLWRTADAAAAGHLASLLQLGQGDSGDPGQTHVRAGMAGGRVSVAVRRPGEPEFSVELPALVHPVAVGDRVVCRREAGVTALATDTGRELWTAEFPLYREALAGKTVNQYLPVAGDVGRYTLCAGDGLVFAVGRFRRLSPDTYRKFAASSDPDTSALAALSVSDGATVWEVGAGKGEGEAVRKAKFLSAPAFHAGKVFAVVKTGNRYGAVCLDARTGRRVWDVPIGPIPTHSGEQMSWQAAYTMEIMTERASAPAVADGVVYLTSNAGLLAALDEATGAPLWAFRYNSRVVTTSDIGRSFEVANMAFLISGARRPFPPQNPILVVGGRVIAAPSDSDAVLALHARSGELLWEAARKGRRDLSAVDGERILLSGPDLVFLSVADGAIARQVDAQVADRPALTPSAVVAGGPGRIVRVELSDYTVTEYPLGETQAFLGRFVVAGRRLVSVNGAGACAFSGFDDAWTALSARLEAAKDAAGRLEVLVQRGVLAFHAGRMEPAAASFRGAVAAAKDVKSESASRASMWLHRTLLRHAGETADDAVVSACLAEAAAAGAGDADRGFEVMRAKLRAEERFGRIGQAVETAQAIAGSAANRWVPATEGGGDSSGPWMSGRQWGRREVERLLRRHGRSSYAAFDARLAEALEQGLKAGDVEGLLAAWRRWPLAERADELLYRTAEAVLRRAETGASDRETLARADRLLGRIDPQGEWGARAAAAQLALDVRHRPALTPDLHARARSLPGDTPVSFPDIQGTVAGLLRADRRRIGGEPLSFASLPGEVAFLSECTEAAPAVLRSPEGRSVLPGDRLLCVQDDRSVRCVNLQHGDLSSSEWRAAVPAVQVPNSRLGFYSPETNALAVLTAEHVVVFDAATGAELARRATREMGVFPWTIALGSGTRVLLANEQQDWIACVGLPDAAVRWRVRGGGFARERLAFASDQVFLCKPSWRASVRVLDARAGRPVFGLDDETLLGAMNSDGFCAVARGERSRAIEFHDPRRPRPQPFARCAVTNVPHDVVAFGERYAVACERRDPSALKFADVAGETPLRTVRIAPEGVTNAAVAGLAWNDGAVALLCGEPAGSLGRVTGARMVAVDPAAGTVRWQLTLAGPGGGSAFVAGPHRYGGLLAALIQPVGSGAARHLAVDADRGLVVADVSEPFGNARRLAPRSADWVRPPVILNGRMVLETGRGLICIGSEP